MTLTRVIPAKYLHLLTGIEPYIIKLIVFTTLIFIPNVVPINYFLNKLEKEHKIIYESIKSQWKDKQFAGLVTLIGGFLALFGYMELSEYY